LLVRLHPSAVPRLLADEGGDVLPAGPARAVQAGADLVAVNSPAEVYMPHARWPALARRWHAQLPAVEGNLRVRLPRDVWPFADYGRVGAAALAADLLDSPEPRATDAGLGLLRDLYRRTVSPV
jgi:hypothetical protein